MRGGNAYTWDGLPRESAVLAGSHRFPGSTGTQRPDAIGVRINRKEDGLETNKLANQGSLLEELKEGKLW